MSDEDWIDDDPGDPALHAELGALLRGEAPAAPPRLERRALGRIRLEREVIVVAQTLGDALWRVAAALPTYLPTRGVLTQRPYTTVSQHTPGETPRGGDA